MTERTNFQELALECFLLFVFANLVTATQVKVMKCTAGDEASFECPCCPEEFAHCRFKKLFKEGYILRDGTMLNGNNRFRMDDNKTHITLKECNKVDEGTYVWMCGKCNVNRHFHLEVHKVSDHVCSTGDEVTFESLCPQDLKNCSFRKLGGDVYIVRRGALVNDFKYAFDAQYRVTLKQCSKHDEGTYQWICGDCQAFSNLTVSQGPAQLLENSVQGNYYATSLSRSIYEVALINILFAIYIYCFLT